MSSHARVDRVPAYNKYETSDCTGYHEVKPLRSSCLQPVVSGEVETGLLASGTLYEYVRIECFGGDVTPVQPPSPKAYPVVSPVYIPICFAASETLLTLNRGVVFISEIKTGDKVFGYNSYTDTFEYSSVVAVPHDRNNDRYLFTEITIHNSSKSIRLSPNHLMLTCDQEDKKGVLKQASEMKINDCVKTLYGSASIVSLALVEGEGAYTIVTEADYLVVNEFVVSPFSVSHHVGDAYYSIHRWLYKHFGSNIVASDSMTKFNSIVADGAIAITNRVMGN